MPFPGEQWAAEIILAAEEKMKKENPMTPPVPPDGFELVDDEPREGDVALFSEAWYLVCDDNTIAEEVDGGPIDARELRWIARKKW